jgi:hypothetical protein
MGTEKACVLVPDEVNKGKKSIQAFRLERKTKATKWWYIVTWHRDEDKYVPRKEEPNPTSRAPSVARR